VKLKDAVVLITGAARGIGRAEAEAFAARGSRLVLVDVLEKTLQDTATEIAARQVDALPLVCDITDVGQVEKMVERVESGFGPIDILINNAGTFSVIDPVWDADPERWFRDICTNLYGTFLCCRAVVRRMVARGRGYVLNTVGGGISDPHPYCTSYASSKTGLMRLTEGLAAEAKPHRVKVFALAPPAVLTDMTRFIMDDPGGKKWRPNFHEIFERGWDGPPEVVANMALSLVSGKADALTGRYFEATSDFEQTVGRADEILAEDLLTLRIRQ
jgi:NAD(P)-dependent dehydrogenase (short-subunit alcohol dehydrogenase family)